MPQEKPENLGKQDVWLSLSADEADLIWNVLENMEGPAASSVLGKLTTIHENTEHDEAFREAVLDRYGSVLTDGDLNTDPSALVSKGDDGAYVMAFLYVTNADVGLEFPEDDLEM